MLLREMLSRGGGRGSVGDSSSLSAGDYSDCRSGPTYRFDLTRSVLLAQAMVDTSTMAGSLHREKMAENRRFEDGSCRAEMLKVDFCDVSAPTTRSLVSCVSHSWTKVPEARQSGGATPKAT